MLSLSSTQRPMFIQAKLVSVVPRERCRFNIHPFRKDVSIVKLSKETVQFSNMRRSSQSMLVHGTDTYHSYKKQDLNQHPLGSPLNRSKLLFNQKGRGQTINPSFARFDPSLQPKDWPSREKAVLLSVSLQCTLHASRFHGPVSK